MLSEWTPCCLMWWFPGSMLSGYEGACDREIKHSDGKWFWLAQFLLLSPADYFGVVSALTILWLWPANKDMDSLFPANWHFSRCTVRREFISTLYILYWLSNQNRDDLFSQCQLKISFLLCIASKVAGKLRHYQPKDVCSISCYSTEIMYVGLLSGKS